MNGSADLYEKIEQYCLDLMDSRERHFFELEMEHNAALQQAVDEYRTLLQSFDHMQSRAFIHSSLDHLHRHSRSHSEVIVNRLRLHVSKYWRTASVAASVAFVASMITFLGARSLYKKDTHAQYQTLRNEISSIKRDQADIKEEVDRVKSAQTVLPDYPSKYSGTAFAIGRNGYLVTNLHVLEGNGKIFVVTPDGAGHTAEVATTDPDNDLAVIRITEEGFSFPGKPPYSIRKGSPSLAQRIFSMGYPKDEIVYNEGYISSTTGFDGDTARFQLELPSGPGVSGAPIIDEKGQLAGIVSGKQSQSEGITFAIKPRALQRLLKNLPPDFNATDLQTNELGGLNRAAQVKKMHPFVCVVKVYN
jgi:serine protease Do